MSATLLAPVVAYFIVRNLGLGLAPQIAAVTGASLPPTSHLPQATLLARTVQMPDAKTGARELEVAQRTLAETPLANEPFIIASKAAEQAGSLRLAVRRLEEAKRRRPNRTSVRAQLLAHYGRTGNIPGFIGEMNYVLARSERSRAAILPQLVKALRDPASRVAMADILAKEPSWRADFFAVAGGQAVNPRDATALVERIRARKGGRNMDLENAFYIKSLLSAGQYLTAKRLWQQSHRISEDALVIDPNFAGVRAPEPFNWVFPSLDVGGAGIVPRSEGGPRLDVEYVGGKAAMLGEQMLALAPGRYRLAFSVSGNAPPQSSSVFWSISCLPGGKELIRLPTGPLQEARVTRSASFVVPAGCAGQALRLVVEPGEFPAPVTFSFGEVDVKRG